MVTKKRTSTTKTSATKKSVAPRSKVSQKVDYYPNRMTVAVSVLAVVSLMLLCAMATYGLE